MAKNTKYLIIACIVLVILLLAGFVYLQGTQNNNAAPTPTPTAKPTPVPTSTPTPAPSSSAISTPTGMALPTPPVIPTIPGMVSHTPPVIPTVIPPTSTPTPSVQASVTPTPVLDGWPYYHMQYGPVRTTGTITVLVNHGENHPLEGQSVGVLAGSHIVPVGSTAEFVTAAGSGAEKVSIPMFTIPTTWVTTGADCSALLGAFADGTYTVYYQSSSHYYMTEIIVINDDHRDWVVNFIAPR